ncbi:hypothetical protein [Sulfurimonas autotrophica]|uniref:Porin n=1 Tax=Sulfurimonas autotrophica (strain ATCC BAA-671 / DSM 16294 / JCM 11897 / OK10) TaxID=563040 RepID=E0UQN5_SULAO|nr:hypothetical protein [Sulfurimonas autotrophica]ADN09907.1 conserved hypothetical protein [Sulfurimonas autotrophica DSM 16294]
MKKIVLSALAALTLGSVAANAGATKLYQDANGQVFTKSAEGRTLIKTPTSVFSKADKLKFSGLTYLGYTYNDYDSTLADGSINSNKDTSEFEIRRAYFQLKAYLLDDSKSYYRITFDISKDVTGDEKVRAKYAYLFLNNVFANTGVEIGLAHRPWHDYEEHNAWYFRNISKILIEDKAHGPDLSNSADFGVMFKTRTQYFDADYGLFNGEGYHSASNGNGMSFEWRTTAHLMGVDGKDKQTKKTYWDASFFGQYNQGHKSVTVGTVTEQQDLIFGGLHTVYNQPSFLVAAQYVYSKDTSDIANNVSKQSGDGYSVNAEYRLGEEKEYRCFARYDSWTPKTKTTYNGVSAEREDRGYLIGAAWEMNKNVQWVANAIITDNEAGSAKEINNGTAYMLTAEVRF